MCQNISIHVRVFYSWKVASILPQIFDKIFWGPGYKLSMPFVRDDGRLIPKPAAASWADCRHAGVVVFGHVLLHPGLVDLPPTFVAGNLCLVVGQSWRQKSAFKRKKGKNSISGLWNSVIRLLLCNCQGLAVVWTIWWLNFCPYFDSWLFSPKPWHKIVFPNQKAYIICCRMLVLSANV